MRSNAKWIVRFAVIIIGAGVLLGCVTFGLNPTIYVVREVARTPRDFDGKIITLDGFITLRFEDCNVKDNAGAAVPEIVISVKKYGCTTALISLLSVSQRGRVTGRFTFRPERMAPLQLEEASFDNSIEARIRAVRDEYHLD